MNTSYGNLVAILIFSVIILSVLILIYKIKVTRPREIAGEFKKRFGIQFPNTHSEIEATKPIIISVLNNQLSVIKELQKNISKSKGDAEKIPGIPENIQARVGAFELCYKLEKNLEQSVNVFMGLCWLAYEAGYCDVTIKFGYPPPPLENTCYS